jgi:hypothetical protein
LLLPGISIYPLCPNLSTCPQHCYPRQAWTSDKAHWVNFAAVDFAGVAALGPRQAADLLRQAAGIALAKKRGVYKGRKKGTTKLKPEKVLEMRETLKPRQIAKLMDVTPKTVYNTLKCATKRLTEEEPAE